MQGIDMLMLGKPHLYLLALLTFPLLQAFGDNETRVPHPELDGKIIRSINIVVKNIFDVDEQGALYRAANSVKIQTRQEVVSRELFFKEGEPYNDFSIAESERQLRLQRYLRSANIYPKVDGEFVDIEVVVQDTWTIIPQISYSNGGGSKKSAYGIAETNLLGYGKRVELLRREVDNRSEIETVYQDPRIFGTKSEFFAAYFDRDDGELALAEITRPFRSLIDKHAWDINTESSDLIGKLFDDGEESYLYRKDSSALRARYTWAYGDPKTRVKRFTLGAGLEDVSFSEATDEDFETLDIDPNSVSRDPALLADNRRYYGPVIGYQDIVPDFISMNYIDRFERVEDYNLGREYSFDFWITPEALGSIEDTLHFNGNRSGGIRFSKNEFARYEFGLGTRMANGLDNTLARSEFKYYNVLGTLNLGSMILGRHTLATNSFIDYGYDLDRDRDFIAGGANVIRGYDNQAFNGDKRLGISLEDRIHLADDILKLFSLGGVFFFDAGTASDRPIGRMISDEIYSSFGAGIRVGFPRSSGGGVARVEVAFPLRDSADGAEKLAPEFTFSVGQFFGARLRSEALGHERTNVSVGFER